MYSPAAPEPTRLADEFWLSAHDGGFTHRSTLSAVTRSLGLAGALLVELVDAGLAQVSTGRPGSRHQPLSTEGETTLLHSVPGHHKINDPALEQVYGIVVRNSDVPNDSPAFFDGPPRSNDPHAHRAGGRRDRGGWAEDGNGRAPAWPQDGPHWRPEPHSPADQFGFQANHRAWPNDPTPTTAGARGSGIPVRNILEFLVIDNRAEQLVINRLLTTGLVRYETRRRLFGSDTKVIVPVNSVISGRARARIIAGLQPAQTYLRRPDADPNAPRGLSDFDKRMAALFAAAGVFDVDQTGLTANEMRVLRAQLQTGIPASVTALLRQVSLVIKAYALNR
jgi:hypothetical protein